jgi:hypothetical protein
MRTSILAGAFLLLALNAGTALAAAFCVVGEDIPPQCMYDDIITCNAAAGASPNTYCDVNPAATLKYFGSQRYCAVNAELQAQCLYNSRILCQGTLNGQPAICIDRGEKPDEITPYRYDPRTQE